MLLWSVVSRELAAAPLRVKVKLDRSLIINFLIWFGKLQGKSPAISKPHGTCQVGNAEGVCILKCTADVNARAIAERRNGGIFHLIPLTRDAEGRHEERNKEEPLG